MKTTFTISFYKNGSLMVETTSADAYETREQALNAAHAHARYWNDIHKLHYDDCEIETNGNGAKTWFLDHAGNRHYTEYKIDA